MPRSAKYPQSKQTLYEVVDHVLYDTLAYGMCRFLNLGQSIRSTFRYDGRQYQEKEFDPSLFQWDCDRNSAQVIPVNQVEDVILWIHRHTDFCCDQTTRQRKVDYEA
jgi:hypothetical protein